ncbi:MAG: DUF3021 domain-containing protein [Lachnospiraceae bacterium]|nr:DUF3021 domain-containing protein [Lachnospiraceae bacterium]
MEKNGKVTPFERYLTKEIGIEFKACLYFFAILFFYCMYKIINGSFEAGIIHMIEMILTCYMIGYIQVYLLWNFDEAEKLGVRECLGMIICTAVYTLVSYFCGWFDKDIISTIIFAIYLLVVYGCVFFIYRSKRHIDDRKLNEELKDFQQKHQKSV